MAAMIDITVVRNPLRVVHGPPATHIYIPHARRLLPGPTGSGTEGGTARVPRATTHAACAYKVLLLILVVVSSPFLIKATIRPIKQGGGTPRKVTIIVTTSESLVQDPIQA